MNTVAARRPAAGLPPGRIRRTAREYRRGPVTQCWNPDLAGYDPACSTTPTNDGLYDTNGDGFCVVDGFMGQRTTANLKAIRFR